LEYSKEQLFWVLQFVSAAVWITCFLKLKRIVESESTFGHGRTGRIGCTELVFVILRTKHFSRQAGRLLFESDYTVYFRQMNISGWF